jgi:PQQ-dependent dehydrogenase (methanol/ethanol family)
MIVSRNLLHAFCFGLLAASVVSAQPADAAKLEAGKASYESRCVGCHASDGTGGGHGPPIIDVRRSRAATPAALREVIVKGIPDAGMPPYPMPEAELDAVVAYVTMLKAPAADYPVAGDAAAGERFFVGGKCSGCHMVRGRGGILGPDLTNLARERKVAQIEQALKDPGGAASASSGGGGRGGPARSFRALSVKLRDGRAIRGIAKYEGPLDVGMQGLDGKFYSISKADVAELTREKSLMPKVEATPAEMRNLLAYLTRLVANGAGAASAAPPAVSAPEGGIKFADIARPKPGEWPSYHGQLSANRHSALDQINTSNVARLAPKWVFPAGTTQRALQVTPVVADGMMFVTAVNEVWALDARTGREIWHWSRARTQGLVGDAAGGINRGVAVLGDRVFLQTDNAHVVALHRLTGQLLWDVEMADSRQHYGSTGAPLAVNDLVIAGVSGGDEGVRGFLDAYKASTGERAWRFWTVPARGEPGSETWEGKALEHGCAATWLTGSYDPEARLLYWPTGNPCPDYNGDQRKGDNLYSNTVLALDPDTGKLKWHFQFTPHDLHDWDATESLVLVDAPFRGRPRKLLLQGNRNGFFYVLDRITGEFLMADPFVKRLTWASGIGPDGKPKLVPGYAPTPEGALACPAVAGATNWPSTAYNPSTGLFYLMAQESCNIYTKNAEEWQRGRSYYGGGTRRAPNEPNAKYLRALDIQTGKTVWEVPVEGGILQSGVMSTAGGLIFYGDSSGAFVAADAKTGKLLWQFNTSMGWKAGPMTYSIAGKQYIGVVAGSTVMAFALP